MRCLRCFLIFLLISAQADDALFVSAVWPVPPVADDDEYLPSDQHDYQERSEARRIFAFARPRPAVANAEVNSQRRWAT